MSDTVIEDHLHSIRKKFLIRLEENCVYLSEQNVQMRAGNFEKASLQKVSDISHNVSGVGATLGFAKLGTLAAKLEHITSNTPQSTIPPDGSSRINALNEFLDEAHVIVAEFRCLTPK